MYAVIASGGKQEKVAQGETVKVEISIAQSEPDTPARAQERDTEVRLAAARRSIDDDSTVRAFRDKFGATIKPDSIRPTCYKNRFIAHGGIYVNRRLEAELTMRFCGSNFFLIVKNCSTLGYMVFNSSESRYGNLAR